MKPWIASVIRGLLILIAGLAGLIGLFMSACGGILLIGRLKGGAILAVGLLCIVACVAFLVWLNYASHRTLIIILAVLLGLLLLAWLLWQTPMHSLQ